MGTHEVVCNTRVVLDMVPVNTLHVRRTVRHRTVRDAVRDATSLDDDVSVIAGDTVRVVGARDAFGRAWLEDAVLEERPRPALPVRRPLRRNAPRPRVVDDKPCVA